MEAMKEAVEREAINMGKHMSSPNIYVQILNTDVYPCMKWNLEKKIVAKI